MDGDILVEHIHLVHIKHLVVVEQLLKVVLVDQILLVLVVMEQHIPFWDPLILGLEVEEVEAKLVELPVLVALVVEVVVE